MRQIPFRLAILPPRAEAGDASMAHGAGLSD